ncbi:MAG: isopentenyl-diphosphate delta-isomerase [Maribacter sp.]|jgi:isopentenyldiphosphate isomerase
MDELLDILDTDGNPTGTTAMKSKAHRFGLFHATVHIWFYTSKGELLLQQRGKHKGTHPLLWGVSVAGHIGAGEELEVSAMREIAEEIGLTSKKELLEKIGIFKSVQKHHEHLIDCEFQHTFLCELSLPLHLLKKQESEVEDLKLMSILNFEKQIQGNKTAQKYVPHELSYYQDVIKSIKERL